MKNPTFPFELIVEILLRLPVRSLLRFKCVCKSWLSLISDPQFAKSHFDLDAAPTHRFLLNYTSGSHKIKSLDFEASFQDDSSVVNLNLSLPPPRRHYNGSEGLDIMGSCRGFILLSNWQSDLIVLNPSTGFHKRIPHLFYNYERYHFLYGIGHVSSTDDYLVVLIQLLEPFATDFRTRSGYFSLKTNAWSNTQYNDFQYGGQGFYSRPGLLLNGALHWLDFSIRTKLYTIIAFDLMEKSLSEIPRSRDLAMALRKKYYYLTVMGGCLSLCVASSSDCSAMTEIWVMKEYKVHSSWTKSFVVSTSGIPRNAFHPICFTKCGGIFGSNGFETLVKLNDKGELLEHRSYMQESGLSCVPLHHHMYRESLLSLPSCFGEASKDNQQ